MKPYLASRKGEITALIIRPAGPRGGFALDLAQRGAEPFPVNPFSPLTIEQTSEVENHYRALGVPVIVR